MPVSIDERLWLSPEGAERSRSSDDAARNSMAALVGRVIGAKPFPETARRLSTMTRMPSARIGSAVRVLETDPALSARLLRLVNSPGYALRMRCTSLRHAAALVGLERLNHIATTAAVLDMFSDSSEAAARLLDHSTVVGAFCRYFAVSFGLPAEELFTCGFLHDIGKLLLLEAEGGGYAELLDASPAQCSHEKERELFGFDHASLGAHVLSAWNIPDPVPLIVAWHHDHRLYEGPPEIGAMVETLRLADQVAHLLGSVGDDQAIRTVAESEAALRLNVGRHDLVRLWPELRSLREHCRAQRSNQANFVDVTSIRPTASLPPPSAPPEPRSGGPVCGECSARASGARCAACQASLCGEHKLPAAEWCERCRRDFKATQSSLGVAPALKLGLAAAVVSLLLGAAVGAWQQGGSASVRLLAAPVVALALSAFVLGAGQRWLVRGRFLRQRRVASLAAEQSRAERAARDADGPPPVLTVRPSAYDSLPVPRELLPPARSALLATRPPPAPAPLAASDTLRSSSIPASAPWVAAPSAPWDDGASLAPNAEPIPTPEAPHDPVFNVTAPWPPAPTDPAIAESSVVMASAEPTPELHVDPLQALPEETFAPRPRADSERGELEPASARELPSAAPAKAAEPPVRERRELPRLGSSPFAVPAPRRGRRERSPRRRLR